MLVSILQGVGRLCFKSASLSAYKEEEYGQVLLVAARRSESCVRILEVCGRPKVPYHLQ
mgnify:CR=1 FL=1